MGLQLIGRPRGDRALLELVAAWGIAGLTSTAAG
jgi:hypothetical protein